VFDEEKQRRWRARAGPKLPSKARFNGRNLTHLTLRVTSRLVGGSPLPTPPAVTNTNVSFLPQKRGRSKKLGKTKKKERKIQ